jgi:hypothetical protein
VLKLSEEEGGSQPWKQGRASKVAAVQNIIKFNNVISPSNLTSAVRQPKQQRREGGYLEAEH